MIEGEGWKRKTEMDEWNSPEKIALDEYTSIINAYCENVLRPIVQGGKEFDRDIPSLIISDLEWKIKDPNFKNLPFKTKDAYINFRRLMKTLEKATDEEIEEHEDVLSGLFSLAINCDVYGLAGMDIYQGRNPCRDGQYVTISALKKAERKGNSQLLDAAKQMAGICKKCPYK